MPTIVMIASVHAENGLCSSAELCRILERLAPEVLFQEIPYFDYLRKREEALRHPARDYRIPVPPLPLEIMAITQYLEGHQLRQVPVDPLGQSGTQNRQHDEVADWVLRNSPDLRHFLDRIQCHESENGFAHLNALHHSKELRNFDDAFLDALRMFQNPRFSEYYSSWKDYNARREESMIKNIVEFSENNTFDSAVFLFGAAHRQGLIREIQRVKRQRANQIEWKLYH